MCTSMEVSLGAGVHACMEERKQLRKETIKMNSQQEKSDCGNRW